jgi:hypothetical protein
MPMIRSATVEWSPISVLGAGAAASVPGFGKGLALEQLLDRASAGS